MTRKITLTIDGEEVSITDAGREALEKICEQIQPDYTRTANVSIHATTAQGLARNQLIRFREKWATVEATLTPRGIQAVTGLQARGLLPRPK